MLEFELSARIPGQQRKLKVVVDLANFRWRLRDKQAGWDALFADSEGVVEKKPWDVLWLKDNARPSSAVRVILHHPPSAAVDRLRRSGSGRIYRANNQSWSDRRLKWTASQAKPVQPGGADSAIRTEILRLCRAEFPQKKFTFRNYGSGPKGTGCGLLPGEILRQLPVRNNWMAFRTTIAGYELKLTSPTPNWDTFSQHIDKRKRLTGENCTWIPFRGTNRPKPG